ncbi:hypothetical protein ACSDQ9_05765 [Aestuariimicrobium soli]|uniref:hypothetical protein n=1 Tax=Aestuariimicrobium soli TaxID=2035834 RepID=UPI003EBCE63F
MTEPNRWITVEDGDQIYEINALDIEDPDENMVRTLTALEEGYLPALFDLTRLLGIDTTGWRMSRVAECWQAIKKAVELDAGESSGSGKSSEPTAKKSRSRSSSRG